jgi:predicted Zn-dependent protease
LKDVSTSLREIYGKNYAKTHPEVEQLRADIQCIFAAKTKRTAHKRYDQVMARRKDFVPVTPQAAAIFDFLERHRLAPTGLAYVGERHREPGHSQD